MSESAPRVPVSTPVPLEEYRQRLAARLNREVSLGEASLHQYLNILNRPHLIPIIDLLCPQMYQLHPSPKSHRDWANFRPAKKLIEPTTFRIMELLMSFDIERVRIHYRFVNDGVPRSEKEIEFERVASSLTRWMEPEVLICSYRKCAGLSMMKLRDSYDKQNRLLNSSSATVGGENTRVLGSTGTGRSQAGTTQYPVPSQPATESVISSEGSAVTADEMFSVVEALHRSKGLGRRRLNKILSMIENGSEEDGVGAEGEGTLRSRKRARTSKEEVEATVQTTNTIPPMPSEAEAVDPPSETEVGGSSVEKAESSEIKREERDFWSTIPVWEE